MHVAETGVASSEIIQGDPDSKRPEEEQRCSRLFKISNDGGLGHLYLDAVGCNRTILDDREDVQHRFGRTDISRR